jgi:hypothetical protein
MEQPRQSQSSLRLDLNRYKHPKEQSKSQTSLYKARPSASTKTSDRSLSYKRPNLSIEVEDFNPVINDDQVIEAFNFFNLLNDLVRKLKLI